MLISQLPPESATATAIRNAVAESGEAEVGGDDVDPSEGRWSLTNILLAGLTDEIRWQRFEFRQVNSSQPGQAPSQVPRPGIKAKKQRRAKITMEQRVMLDPRLRGEWHE